MIHYKEFKESINLGSIFSQFLISGGADGTAYIYDLCRKTLLNLVHYPAGVTCLLSVPLEVSSIIRFMESDT